MAQQDDALLFFLVSGSSCAPQTSFSNCWSMGNDSQFYEKPFQYQYYVCRSRATLPTKSTHLNCLNYISSSTENTILLFRGFSVNISVLSIEYRIIWSVLFFKTIQDWMKLQLEILERIYHWKSFRGVLIICSWDKVFNSRNLQAIKPATSTNQNSNLI